MAELPSNFKIGVELAMCTGDNIWKLTVYMNNIIMCAAKNDSGEAGEVYQRH